MKNTTDPNTMEVSWVDQYPRQRGLQVINYLKNLRSFLIAPVAEASLQPIEIGGWKPQGVVRESLEKLVRSFQNLVDFLIRFGITCLPFLIPLGVGIFFLVKALRKRSANRPSRRKNRDMASPTSVEIPPVEPEDKK